MKHDKNKRQKFALFYCEVKKTLDKKKYLH